MPYWKTLLFTSFIMIIEFTNIISKIFSIKYLESSGLMISFVVLTHTICSHFLVNIL